MNEYLDRIEW